MNKAVQKSVDDINLYYIRKRYKKKIFNVTVSYHNNYRFINIKYSYETYSNKIFKSEESYGVCMENTRCGEMTPTYKEKPKRFIDYFILNSLYYSIKTPDIIYYIIWCGKMMHNFNIGKDAAGIIYILKMLLNDIYQHKIETYKRLTEKYLKDIDNAYTFIKTDYELLHQKVSDIKVAFSNSVFDLLEFKKDF